MTLSRQRDHARHIRKRSVRACRLIMKEMAHRRSQQRNAERSGSLFHAVQQFTAVSANDKLDLRRSQRVSSSYFSFNLNELSDRDCLMQFVFRKEDIIRMIPVVSFPESVTHTARND